MKTKVSKMSLRNAALGSLMIAFAILLSPLHVTAQWQDPAPLPEPCPGEPTNDWGQCLADLDGRVAYSTATQVDCEITCEINCFNSPTYAQCLTDCRNQCMSDYNSNLGETQQLYSQCICSTLDNPAPWPVIDNSLSWCLEGCDQCDQADTPLSRFVCKMDCRSFCFANHPKQGGQGGGG